MTKNTPIEYSNYLELKTLLNSQHLESAKFQDKPAHEEMLFIITHQTYELWFKQILWEIDSFLTIFKENSISNENLSKAVHRIKRVNEIFKVLISQITVLETMTAMEFLEFRNYLYPASGFQSAQFRLLENKLGLNKSQRKIHGGCPYHAFLKEEEKSVVIASETEPCVLKSVGAWLERTPYLKTEGYNFWSEYKSCVEKMFFQEDELIKNNSKLSKNEKQKSFKNIEETRKSFRQFMDKNEFLKSTDWSLSFKALQAALFIQLYRHELKLQSANRLIEQLIDLDENMTQWRNRHAQMALRMLGHKVGTGGSSGEKYLKSAAQDHKIFDDFFRLTTFFIDGKKLSKLPELK